MLNTGVNSVFDKALDPNVSSEPELKYENPAITQTRTNSIVSSSLFKSVLLHDWWLMKPANGEGLAVGGFASLERVGTRVFCSAAILKRHDAVTLETADGISITICNFINRSRTHQNGFDLEVCNHFWFGFPYNWEDYAVGCSGDKHRASASNECYMSIGDSANKTLPFSFDDLPVTRVRDLLLPSFGDPEKCLLTESIFNDILGKSKGNSPIKNLDSGSDETPVNQKETKVDNKFDNDNSILNSRHMTKEEHQKASCHSEMATDVLTSTRGVCTRSMARSKNSGMKHEVVSSNSPGKSTEVHQNVSHPTSSFGDNVTLVTADKRKRGRPRKYSFGEENVTLVTGEHNVTLVTADKPKVGRPRKSSFGEDNVTLVTGEDNVTLVTADKPKVGRPRKYSFGEDNVTLATGEDDVTLVTADKPKVGKPMKYSFGEDNVTLATGEDDVTFVTADKPKVGRPRKSSFGEDNVTLVTAEKRKVGRPRKS